jgi:hypothetical protein
MPSAVGTLPIRASAAALPPAPASAPSVASSATAQIASRVAGDLGASAKDSAIFVAPVRSDEPAPRGGELASKMVGLIAGALGGGASARSEPVPLSTAQALARRNKVLVYVQVDIARGQLRVTADAYRTTRNVWDRARQPVPAPIAHSFASARIDGEVRSYLAPIPLLANHVDRIASEDKDLVALACGDVDDDGALEIVTLSRRRATLGRVRAGRFIPLKIASLHDLSGIAPAPLREPVAGLAIVPREGTRPSHVDIGITDRAHGSRLDGDLRPLGAITGVPFATSKGDACMTFQGSTLAASIAKCAEGDGPAPPADIETPLDSAAVATFVSADGTVREIVATRDPRSAELHLRAGGRAGTLAHAGAQVAVADLDQDGSPEILSTLDVLPKAANGTDDALVITTWQPDGSLLERARTPVPSGVRAVAACPPEGGGASSVVIATQGELWIIR